MADESPNSHSRNNSLYQPMKDGWLIDEYVATISNSSRQPSDEELSRWGQSERIGWSVLQGMYLAREKARFEKERNLLYPHDDGRNASLPLAVNPQWLNPRLSSPSTVVPRPPRTWTGDPKSADRRVHSLQHRSLPQRQQDAITAQTPAFPITPEAALAEDPRTPRATAPTKIYSDMVSLHRDVQTHSPECSPSSRNALSEAIAKLCAGETVLLPVLNSKPRYFRMEPESLRRNAISEYAYLVQERPLAADVLSPVEWARQAGIWTTFVGLKGKAGPREGNAKRAAQWSFINLSEDEKVPNDSTAMIQCCWGDCVNRHFPEGKIWATHIENESGHMDTLEGAGQVTCRWRNCNASFDDRKQSKKLRKLKLHVQRYHFGYGNWCLCPWCWALNSPHHYLNHHGIAAQCSWNPENMTVDELRDFVACEMGTPYGRKRAEELLMPPARQQYIAADEFVQGSSNDVRLQRDVDEAPNGSALPSPPPTDQPHESAQPQTNNDMSPPMAPSGVQVFPIFVDGASGLSVASAPSFDNDYETSIARGYVVPDFPPLITTQQNVCSGSSLVEDAEEQSLFKTPPSEEYMDVEDVDKGCSW